MQTNSISSPDFYRALQRWLCVLALLVISGCSGGILQEGRSPPGVVLPEPGTPAARGQARRSAPVPAARSYPRQAPSAYPRESEPAYAGARSSAAPGELPIPGAAAYDDSLVIEQPQGGDDRNALPDYAPARSSNSAVNTLLAQADEQRRGGNVDAAIAAAERALRIAPGDPAVYYQLAALRLQRGDVELAEQLARKGLSYQPGPELRLRLQEIIDRTHLRG